MHLLKDFLKNASPTMKALVTSSVLNFILLSVLCYNWMSERPPIPYYTLKPQEETHQHISAADNQTNVQMIQQFRNMSIEQLAAKLSNTQTVENGFTQRDLALACLVSFHHFNFSKAILGLPPSSPRKIALGQEEVIVYSGLTDQHYEAIIHFANTERWPFTTKGLFLLLQKPEYRQDVSLEETFLLTQEFLAVETLFNRSKMPVERKELLKMLVDGDWQILLAFAEQQRASQDLSPMQRQKFLLNYLTTKKSATAAYLLLKNDLEFVSKRLDDPTILLLFQIVKEKTPEAEKFAVEMLTSQRSDAVRYQAAVALYGFANETVPPKLTQDVALARFAPKKAIAATTKTQKAPEKKVNAVASPSKKILVAKPPKQEKKAAQKVAATKPPMKIPAKPAKKESLYVVQEGDSLWKISKRFNVDVEVLKKHNKLNSNNLKPGSSLKIPS